MDKNELKVQALREALRERVASITDEYENRIADLRIELTEAALENQNLKAALDAKETDVPQEGTGEDQ